MSGRDVIGLLSLALLLTFATGAIIRSGQTSAIAQTIFQGFDNTLQIAGGQGGGNVGKTYAIS